MNPYAHPSAMAAPAARVLRTGTLLRFANGSLTPEYPSAVLPAQSPLPTIEALRASDRLRISTVASTEQQVLVLTSAIGPEKATALPRDEGARGVAT